MREVAEWAVRRRRHNANSDPNNGTSRAGGRNRRTNFRSEPRNPRNEHGADASVRCSNAGLSGLQCDLLIIGNVRTSEYLNALSNVGRGMHVAKITLVICRSCCFELVSLSSECYTIMRLLFFVSARPDYGWPGLALAQARDAVETIGEFRSFAMMKQHKHHHHRHHHDHHYHR